MERLHTASARTVLPLRRFGSTCIYPNSFTLSHVKQ